MTVRLAAKADLQAILRLERESSTAPHWGIDVYERMLEEASAGELKRVLMVAVGGFMLCGYAVGKALGEEAELESVVVDPDRQRQGIGKMLCEAVIDWAGEQGARTMDLEVRGGSAGAQRLYRGLGFREVALRAAYYRDPVEDAVVMRCEVGRSMLSPDANAEV